MLKTRKQLFDRNPVTIALKALRHREELIETRVVELLAIEALETGTANQYDLIGLCYMAEMTHALGRAGYLPDGMTDKELTALCKKALTFNDVSLLKQINAIHEAQTSACSATEYLKARQSEVDPIWTYAAGLAAVPR